jgi:hypothetical protein
MWETVGHVADMSMAIAWFMAAIVQGTDATVVRRSKRAASGSVPEGALLERQRLADLGEGRRGLVALGKERVVNRPLDPNAGIVPSYAGLRSGVVGAGAEVGDVGDLAEHGETVAEADRDEELAMLLVVEDVPLPLAVGRRVAAQVDGNVEDLAARAANQLRLARLGLEVEAAQGAPGGARVVVLDELRPRARPRGRGDRSRP